MTKYVSFRDGGKTDEGGISRYVKKFLQGDTFTGLQVTQQSPLALGVTVGTGDMMIDSGNGYPYIAWSDATSNVTLSTADGTNPRYDLIVAYIDLSVVSSASPNNPGAFKIDKVTGTPAGSPTEPNNTAIHTAIGASNPYVILARVTVGAGVTSISNSNIVDRRTLVSLSVPNMETTAGGWAALGFTPNTVTYNGNRSYDLVFNSTNLTTVTSNGMRLKLTRTVTAPTYMGGPFNGTNQYFTKVTPSGTLGTVTNNFTIMGHFTPTSYPAADTYICGRADSTPNNLLGVVFDSAGRIGIKILSGGTANSRQVMTNHSLPLNKKSSFVLTWASGTVTALIDGASMPVATATTGGTAPTTAGTGGDWSIGRPGAYNGNYLTGYASGIAVFDAVLSASTARSYLPQVISGSETNCIGAWSLNNTANDQSAAANNLTAQNSVSYTSGVSPYATQADGTSNGTTEHAVITKTAYSTNTTLTVQVPEGCAIPTTGGVTAVSYSTQKVPYGFPTQTSRWNLVSLIFVATSQAATAGTWYNVANHQLNLPIGEWKVCYQTSPYISATTGTVLYQTLSTGAATESNPEFTTEFYNPATAAFGLPRYRQRPVSQTTMAPLYLNLKQAGGTAVTIQNAETAYPLIEAENAYL